MELYLLIGSAVLLVVLVIIVLVKNNGKHDLSNELENMKAFVKEELSDTRRENRELNQENRKEINDVFEGLQNSLLTRITENINHQKTQLDAFAKSLIDISDKMSTNFDAFKRTIQEDAKENRKEQAEGLKSFEEKFSSSIKEIRETVEKQLKAIREDNTIQLNEMRTTVDEKLQKTLNERLSQSFETVGKQLQEVQKGLGEMKNLATDVGGLKKVLSNVKMRGGIGEIQLSMLLEQILAPDQYEANVKTKLSSNEIVEFAIKLPGKDDSGKNVWLPIDAKFPKDIYEQLQEAYEDGDLTKIAVAQKNMDNTIKKMAKDIGEKYLDPPNTTDFGIMFLPFEGIYAEVVRKAALLEDLQRNYKIIVTGPTTLAAILNSLQMGFQTLAIQKRSSEVWQVLGAVKKEFENFGGMMDKAQKNIQTGLNQLDDVMGKRTRAIQRKLKNVEALSENETRKVLPEISDPSQEQMFLDTE